MKKHDAQNTLDLGPEFTMSKKLVLLKARRNSISSRETLFSIEHTHICDNTKLWFVTLWPEK